jgi:hypothetical protein
MAWQKTTLNVSAQTFSSSGGAGSKASHDGTSDISIVSASSGQLSFCEFEIAQLENIYRMELVFRIKDFNLNSYITFFSTEPDWLNNRKYKNDVVFEISQCENLYYPTSQAAPYIYKKTILDLSAFKSFTMDGSTTSEQMNFVIMDKSGESFSVALQAYGLELV